jgi:hypothetical protein
VTRTAELARYKLGRISRDDEDGVGAVRRPQGDPDLRFLPEARALACILGLRG